MKGLSFCYPGDHHQGARGGPQGTRFWFVRGPPLRQASSRGLSKKQEELCAAGTVSGARGGFDSPPHPLFEGSTTVHRGAPQPGFTPGLIPHSGPWPDRLPQAQSGPTCGLSGRVVIFCFRDDPPGLVFDPRGLAFDPRGLGFDHRGPPFKPTSPDFDPRGPLFNPEHRDFTPTGPHFDPTNPNFHCGGPDVAVGEMVHTFQSRSRSDA